MQRRALPILLVTLCSLLLAACGFQLRGAQQYQDLPALAVDAGSLPQFRHQLTRALVNAQTPVHDSARLVLEVEHPRIDQRTVAVDTLGRAAEMELTFSFRWRLVDRVEDQPLTRYQPLRLIRTFHYDPDNATASSDEDASTRRSLYEDASWQVLRQLHAALQPLRDSHPDLFQEHP